jgi:hypothetical protein
MGAPGKEKLIGFNLLGERWTVHLCPRSMFEGDDRGYTILPGGDDRSKGREIWLWRGLRGRARLVAFIHEYLHAVEWYRDHEWIEPVSEALAKILAADGWDRGV